MNEFATDFDIFWAAYPRRAAKKDALKAWRQLRPDAELVQKILDALAWQTQTDQWKRKIIPLPASYLRGERWEDEGPACACRKAQPPPPAPVVELARSIARQRAEDSEEARLKIDRRVQQLVGLGISEPLAIIQASQEWLKQQ